MTVPRSKPRPSKPPKIVDAVARQLVRMFRSEIVRLRSEAASEWPPREVDFDPAALTLLEVRVTYGSEEFAVSCSYDASAFEARV